MPLSRADRRLDSGSSEDKLLDQDQASTGPDVRSMLVRARLFHLPMINFGVHNVI